MRNKFENYELQGSIKTYEKKEITQDIKEKDTEESSGLHRVWVEKSSSKGD